MFIKLEKNGNEKIVNILRVLSLDYTINLCDIRSNYMPRKECVILLSFILSR